MDIIKECSGGDLNCLLFFCSNGNFSCNTRSYTYGKLVHNIVERGISKIVKREREREEKKIHSGGCNKFPDNS